MTYSTTLLSVSCSSLTPEGKVLLDRSGDFVGALTGGPSRFLGLCCVRVSHRRLITVARQTMRTRYLLRGLDQLGGSKGEEEGK